MMKDFTDNANAPIVAIDFDGTITARNTYPNFTEPRKYAKQVINFLVDIGVNVVVWTCRDTGIDQNSHRVIDDITPMIQYLEQHGIKYTAINKSSHLSPFTYQARKVYAHMYVDDKAYGWREYDEAMVSVLAYFIFNVLHATKCIERAITYASIVCGTFNSKSPSFSLDYITQICHEKVMEWGATK